MALIRRTLIFNSHFIRFYKTAASNYEFRENKTYDKKPLGDQKTHFIQHSITNGKVRGDTKL